MKYPQFPLFFSSLKRGPVQTLTVLLFLSTLLFSIDGHTQNTLTASARFMQKTRSSLLAGNAQDIIVLFKSQEIDTDIAKLKRQRGLQHDDQEMLDTRAQRYESLKHGVLAALPSKDHETLASYSHLPMVFMRILSAKALDALKEDPNFLAAYPNGLKRKTLDTSSKTLVNIPTATAVGLTGLGQTVLVVDSGVNYTEPDLGSCSFPGYPSSCKISQALAYNRNYGYMYQDNLSYSSPYNDHGTAVAGVVAGTAPDAKIIVINVFGASESTYDSDVIAAINWGIQNQSTYKIASINLSLGGDDKYASICSSNNPYVAPIAAARNAGIVTVVSSGNENYIDGLSLPACTPGALSVGAVYAGNLGAKTYPGAPSAAPPVAACTDSTTTADKVVCFSNSASFLALLAPGVDITAGGFTSSGTSFAAPFAAGAAAILKAIRPAETVDRTIFRLKQGDPVVDSRNGISFPRLNILKAAQYVFPIPNDVNADGHEDLVKYNPTTGQASLSIDYFNPDGSSASHYDKALVRDAYFAIKATPDLNGDGKADLIWIDNTGKIRIQLMSGMTMISEALLETNNDELSIVATPDLNGDGKADLVLWDAKNGLTHLWLMNGGSVISSTALPQEAGWKVTKTADFNGDGKADLLWYNATMGGTRVWLMNGANSISQTVILTDLNWKVTNTADFNGDGKADLLWYNTTTGKTSVWLMNGASSISQTVILTDPNWKVTNTADFNGDGKADLLWYNAATGQTAVWLMNGASMISGLIVLTDPNWKVTHTADFNGDGKADLLWYNAATGQTGEWLMNGATAISGSLVLTDPNWQVANTADFNGDGKADLLWDNKLNLLKDNNLNHPITRYMALWLMNGKDSIGQGLVWVDPPLELTAIADFNGDGMADLLWYNAATGQTSVWLMDDWSSNSQTKVVLLIDPSWKVTKAADFNGDGKADLLWYNATTGKTSVWLMNGASLISQTIILTDLNLKVTNTADFNGDGKADLLWYNATTGLTSVWLMNGASPISQTVILTDLNLKVTNTADFNGDGKVDLLWYNATTGQTRMWLMNGASSISQTVILTNPSWKVTNTADFNGDGKADLLWYSAATGQTAMWLMNGASMISGSIVLTDLNWKVTRTADFNGDGNADLLWYNSATGQTAKWFMKGASMMTGTLLSLGLGWVVY